jgi:CRISPR-associated protein Cas1
MEEFRAFVADRLALSLINQKQVLETGFQKIESGAVIMNDETRKTVITAYQKRKQDEIFHPFVGEKVQIGQLFFIQAQLLNRYFRDDLDGYPPFVWR